MIKLLIADKWLEYPLDLGMAVYNSPCRVNGVQILTSDGYKNVKGDLAKMLKTIKSMPKFSIGQVIDLSYKNGGMPNRIYITTIFYREQDNEWMYSVILENNNEKTRLGEKFIWDRMSKQVSKVYNNPDIIDRIKDGWRFCGNFATDTATANAKLIASDNTNVRNVRLYPAIGYDNKYLKDKLGIWVRYNTIISNDGTIVGNMVNDQAFIDIK